MNWTKLKKIWKLKRICPPKALFLKLAILYKVIQPKFKRKILLRKVSKTKRMLIKIERKKREKGRRSHNK